MATNRVFSLFQEKKYEDFFPSIKKNILTIYFGNAI